MTAVAERAGPLAGSDSRSAPAAAWGRSRGFALVLGGAVVAGLALRLAIGLTDGAPSTDETAYLRSGISLVDGHGFVRNGQPELHFPPLVPFLLGLASHVFRDPHHGAVALTCVASTALVVPLAFLARRIAGPVAGVTTAWVAALGPAISTTLVNRGAGSEAEYILLVVTAVWFVVDAAGRHGSARAVRVAGSGLLVGLAYLTRPEGLLVAVPLGAAVLTLAGRGTEAGQRLRSIAAAAATFAAPLLVCVVPYVLYLHDHTGQWELSAKTQDVSIEAWDAVARGDRPARDRELYALDETGLNLPDERTPLPTLAREDPSGYLAIVWSNLRALVGELAEPRQFLAWLLLPLPLWGLAALGAWRHRRSGPVVVLLAVAAVSLVTPLVFFVQPRYLLPGVALATVLVGVAMPAVSSRWRAPVVAGAIGLLLLSSLQAFRGGAGWWHPTDQTDHRQAGEWIAANTRTGDRIMARSYVVEYYAERPIVAIPYGSYEQTMRFARHYGVQYLVLDEGTAVRLRPQLAPLRLVDRHPGVRLVHESRAEGRTTRIFALDPPPPRHAPAGPTLGFVGDGSA